MASTNTNISKSWMLDLKNWETTAISTLHFNSVNMLIQNNVYKLVFDGVGNET